MGVNSGVNYSGVNYCDYFCSVFMIDYFCSVFFALCLQQNSTARSQSESSNIVMYVIKEATSLRAFTTCTKKLIPFFSAGSSRSQEKQKITSLDFLLSLLRSALSSYLFLSRLSS